MKIEKILNIVLVVVIAISVVLSITLFSNLTDDAATESWLNVNLSWCYILVVLGGGIAVVASLIHVFSDKDAAKQAGIVFLFALVIFGVSYLTASSKLPQFYGVEKFIADGTLTSNSSKWIDTILRATYILAGITVVMTIFWSLKRVVKS